MNRQHKKQIMIGVISLVLVSIVIWGFPIVQAVSASLEKVPPMISASEPGIQFEIPAKWVGDRNWPSWLERLIPKLTVESRLDGRAETILQSIKFD